MGRKLWRSGRWLPACLPGQGAPSLPRQPVPQVCTEPPTWRALLTNTCLALSPRGSNQTTQTGWDSLPHTPRSQPGAHGASWPPRGRFHQRGRHAGERLLPLCPPSAPPTWPLRFTGPARWPPGCSYKHHQLNATSKASALAVPTNGGRLHPSDPSSAGIPSDVALTTLANTFPPLAPIPSLSSMPGLCAHRCLV